MLAACRKLGILYPPFKNSTNHNALFHIGNTLTLRGRPILQPLSITYPHNSTTCSKQVKSSRACNRFSNIDFSFQLMNEWPWNKQISWIHNIKLDSLIFEKNNWSWRLFSLVFNPIWSIYMIKSWKSMICSRDYGHLMAKSQFFAVQIQIPIPIPNGI